MRRLAEEARIQRLMRALGGTADADTRVYFTGGASAGDRSRPGRALAFHRQIRQDRHPRRPRLADCATAEARTVVARGSGFHRPSADPDEQGGLVVDLSAVTSRALEDSIEDRLQG